MNGVPDTGDIIQNGLAVLVVDLAVSVKIIFQVSAALQGVQGIGVHKAPVADLAAVAMDCAVERAVAVAGRVLVGKGISARSVTAPVSLSTETRWFPVTP